MKNLSLDADDVPVVYRMRVTLNSDGSLIGETTVCELPSHVESRIQRVRDALKREGIDGFTIDYYPA